jgi:LysR family transcriptional regulator, low CO2-responsive transcriptional regulator
MVRIDIFDARSAMDVDQLIAFQRVVREGSFTRAALALGIGQPAVSARIQALESAVGGALFTRGRRVALSALGEVFLPFARRATEILDEGVASTRLAHAGQRGRVTLASLGSLAGGLVAPAIAGMIRSHPEVEWLMRSGNHEAVLAYLWDGIVELGVIAWPSPEAIAADLIRVVVWREPVPLVAAPGHPLTRQRSVTRDDIARLARPFLRLRWWRTHHVEVDRIANRAEQAIDVPMETARALALRGVAVGFFPRTYIADELAAGSLVALAVRDMAPLWRDSALVRRPRVAGAPVIAATIDALRAQAERLGLVRRTSRPRRS